MPELRVANLGDLPLLLLDGELRLGAKQNRILLGLRGLHQRRDG